MRDEKKEVNAQISVLLKRFERAQEEVANLLKAVNSSNFVDQQRNQKTKPDGRSAIFGILKTKLENIQDSLNEFTSSVIALSTKRGDASAPLHVGEQDFANFQTSVENQIETFTETVEEKLSECKKEYFECLSEFYSEFGAEYSVVYQLQHKKFLIEEAKKESQDLLDELYTYPTDNPEDYGDAIEEVGSQIVSYTSEINFIDSKLQGIAPKANHDKPYPVAINVTLQPTAFNVCVELLANNNLEFIIDSTDNLINLNRQENVKILRNLENDRGLPRTKAEEKLLSTNHVLPDPNENTVPNQLEEFRNRKMLY